jgi:hypothetical protein
MDATAQEEMFEIFDADSNLLGLERRSVGSPAMQHSFSYHSNRF